MTGFILDSFYWHIC